MKKIKEGLYEKKNDGVPEEKDRRRLMKGGKIKSTERKQIKCEKRGND